MINQAPQQNAVPSDLLLFRMQTALSEDDYVSANRLFLRARNHSMRIFSAVCSVILAVCAGLLVIFAIASREFSSEMILFAVMAVFFLLLPLIQKISITSSAKKMYAKNPYLREQMQLWIHDDRIEDMNQNMRTVFFWHELHGAAETSDMLMLWQGMQMIVIPAHSIDPSAAAYLHNLLAAKMGAKFRFFAPVCACGTLTLPPEEKPASPLHAALAASAQPQSAHDFPPFVADLPRRPVVRFANRITLVVAALIVGPLVAYIISQPETGAFQPAEFISTLLFFEAVYAGLIALTIWMSKKQMLGAETRVRIVLMPCGFGSDTGRSSVLIPWDKISVKDTGKAFFVSNQDIPSQPIKILCSDLSEENAMEMRRLFIRCCGDRYQNKTGKVPR